jgi:hypothetical protein
LPEGDFGIWPTTSRQRTPLVRRHAFGDEGHQLFRRGLALQHDERPRQLPSLLVRQGNDRGVGDGRML